ncbi:DNA translocase FtsK 4TM domain-containing protein [Alkalibacter sp. M17DMB]|nr:DNA translocase FtsK [Alkalibacter mobilis]MBF7095713.1 DNA translocase FtsK 4TM domain-containing protein [Alkalibacter mobilis]
MLYYLSSEDAGALGNFMRSFISVIFGRTSYFLSIILILLGILIIFSKNSTNNKRVLAAVIISLLLLSMLFSLVDGQVAEKLFSKEIFEFEHSPQIGGGILGSFLSTVSVKLFSLTGTIILMILMALITIVLTTKKSIQEYLKSGKRKIKDASPMKTFKQVAEKQEKVKYDKKTEIKDKEIDNIKILDYSEIRSAGLKASKHEEIKTDDTTVQESRNLEPKTRAMSKINKNDIEKEEKEIEDRIKSNVEPVAYSFPPLNLLENSSADGNPRNRKEVMNRARLLEKTLGDFGVKAKVSEVSVGPTVTRFELHPEPGVKVSKIVNLSNDLALSLATSDVRIEAPIPGKAAIGIEVPNKDSDIVHIREIIESSVFRNHKSKIAFALGKKLSGSAVMADISKMPHLLIAGATGSGKSVCINSILISILYKATPEEVKLILIDPKMVELNNYNGIPHLLIPVVTDPKHAAGALNWGIKEMTERYQAFKDAGVRDIIRYNEVAKEKGEKPMPRIVIIIDELADLMMVSPREVENAICRLAQLARAAGIHLVLATQRPSVDVITGLIKANIPSRISFAVSSMMDSRTILDMGGAEKLLGRGDMLYYPTGEPKPVRIQGTFISDKEVENVVNHVKTDAQPQYNDQVIEEIKENKNPLSEDFEDDMLPKAIEIAVENGTVSTSQLQRKLRLGYSRAGRIIDEMEERGIISGPDGSKPRKVLIDKNEFGKFDEEVK